MSKYLNYKVTNTEPLSIVDMYHSKSDEAVALSYIPGSTMRGMIMSRLAYEQQLETYKKEFFNGNIRFLNAYPAIDNEGSCIASIPSPKGFYENRAADGAIKHTFVNSLDDDGENPLKGMKRAKTGVFASFQDGKLHYISPALGETFKLRMTRNIISDKAEGKKQQIFRGDFINKGHVFCGSICFEEGCSADLIQEIERILKNDVIRLGNARNAGYGKIELTEDIEKSEHNPYDFLSTKGTDKTIVVKEQKKYVVDMLCLSSLCMTNAYGEPCGINEEEFAELLGCENVIVADASSSVTQFNSYNRMRGGRSEQIPVFEGGSIFRLYCSEKPDPEKMRSVEDKGIGLYTNEGFGRVIFVNDIENIGEKISHSPYMVNEKISKQIEKKSVYHKDMEGMKIQCGQSLIKQQIEKQKLKYILEHEFIQGTASKSQRGTVLMMCKSLHHHPERAVEEFEDYFEHIEAKENRAHVNSKNKGSQLKMKKGVMDILKGDIKTLLELEDVKVMGQGFDDVVTVKEERLIKLELIEDMIRYANRRDISSGK